MPTGTRVHDCVKKVKAKNARLRKKAGRSRSKKNREVNAYAVCQASTGQSYATGRPLK